MRKSKLYKPKFYASVTLRAQTTAEIVTELISSTFTISSFIDIGCGDGLWSRKMLEKCDNKIKGYAIDLPGVRPKELQQVASDIQFIELNLNSNPYIPERQFDLAFCTEVLEHLEEHAALLLLNSIAANCDLLVFSAAVPGQGGTGHINEHPQEYWDSQLQKRGFRPFDVIRPAIIELEVPSYYKNNLILYVQLQRFTGQKFLELQKMLLLTFGTPKDQRSKIERMAQAVIRLFPWQVITLISYLKKH